MTTNEKNLMERARMKSARKDKKPDAKTGKKAPHKATMQKPCGPSNMARPKPVAVSVRKTPRHAFTML